MLTQKKNVESYLTPLHFSFSGYVTTNNNSKGPLYITKPANTNRLPNNTNNTSAYVPSLYSNHAQQRPRVDRRYQNDRYYHGPTSNYVTTSFSPQDYLNNPMFDSLNHHRRYWPHERTITLRPLTSRAKNSGLHRKMQMASPRNACKVLS